MWQKKSIKPSAASKRGLVALLSSLPMKPALPSLAHGGVDFSTCGQDVLQFYHCGSQFLGCAVIGTSWEEERQLVSNDLT